MLTILRGLFVSLLDAGNCISVALVVILFCLFMKTDCFESVLAVVYFFCGFYCILKTMLGSSNSVDCSVSSYLPEFVRRRRFVRLDGSEVPKQPSPCEEQLRDKDANHPNHINPPTCSGDNNTSKKKRTKKVKKTQQTVKETISSVSNDANHIDAKPSAQINPPTRSGGGKKKRNKKGQKNQQALKETVNSCSNDAKPIDANPSMRNNLTTRSKDNKIEHNESTENIQPKIKESIDKFSSEPAVPPGLSRKNAKKAKKKKNFAKSKFKTDDSSDGSSTKTDGGYKRDVTEKTKVYSPLKAYLDMGLELYRIYQEFKPYVLSREQLSLYEFPLDSPQTTEKVIVSSKYRKLVPERSCCRCGTTFLIHSDGRYESGTVCRYHPSKMPSYRGNNEAATYTCCNGNYISEGCVQYQYHVTAESFLKDSDFVKTREKKYLNAEKSCTVYALDCEMLYTTNGFEVAKVGIVGIDGLTLYETFVLPEKEVLCYNTTYSGVSANDLKSVTTTLRDVQAYLLKLINKDSILVGHGLENDLRALRLIHENIVDTSVAFPHSRGVRYKRSLKSLSSEFLSKSIQESASGHDCIEDARTCMELMLCKIQSDIENRPAVTVDENENSVFENVPPESQPEMFYYPIISSSYPFYFNESYHFASYYPDQNCRRNSMQRPHYPYYSQSKCYVYS